MSNSLNKKRILIFSEYYLPGYKSGGGMRTIVNIVSRFHDRYEFFIVTKDHDGKSDKQPYKTVKINDWNSIENAQVYYLSKDKITFSKIHELLTKVNPDILYSNSYFSIFDIYLLLLNRLNKVKIPYVVSPCGELSEDSFKMGTLKKRTFVFIAKILDFNKHIIWKASTEIEKQQIEEILGKNEQIIIAPDLIPKVFYNDFSSSKKPEKIVGSVKLVFLSRFNRKKNFKFILENISNTEGDISIDIYGPIDDQEYYNECVALIKKLPKNVKVMFKKSIPHSEVIETLLKYHFFVMPTQHENFGHIFLEAFSAGCPIIISDRTPWQDLENKKIGWDVPLENDSKWRNVLEKVVRMNQEDYSELSDKSRKFVEDWICENDLDAETNKLFLNLSSETLDNNI